MRCLIRVTVAVATLFAALFVGVGSAAASGDIFRKVDPNQCSVELVSEGIIFGYEHLRVVYTDPTGQQFVYEAFPERLNLSDFGNLTPAEVERSDEVLIGETIASGPAACSGGPERITRGSERCFDRISMRIAGADVPYVLFPQADSGTGNSNSYAYTLLVRCRYPNPGLPTDPENVPGWGIDVLAP